MGVRVVHIRYLGEASFFWRRGPGLVVEREAATTATKPISIVWVRKWGKVGATATIATRGKCIQYNRQYNLGGVCPGQLVRVLSLSPAARRAWTYGLGTHPDFLGPANEASETVVFTKRKETRSQQQQNSQEKS